MRRHIFGALVAVLVHGGATYGAAQTLTIPEAVRRMGPEPYFRSRVHELAPLPFEYCVSHADLIVHASVRKLRTYLSADEMTLYTDYEVLPLTVVKAKAAVGSAKPGPNPLVLRQWGGETTIEGIPVTIYDENFPSSLPTDSPLLLFLVFNEDAGKHEIVGSMSGAFAVNPQGKLRHLIISGVDYYEGYNGLDLSEAIRRIHQQLRSQK